MEYFKRFESTDSTMNEAKRYVLTNFNSESWNKRQPILFQAESQTQGRGQHGKSWSSPSGAGLYISLLSSMRIPEENLAAFEATQIVLESIKSVLKEQSFNDLKMFSIKPINDIYWNNKKLAGILIERFSHQGIEYNVIGIGINLYKTNYQLKEPNVAPPKAEPIALEEICGRPKTESCKNLILNKIYDNFQTQYFS